MLLKVELHKHSTIKMWQLSKTCFLKIPKISQNMSKDYFLCFHSIVWETLESSAYRMICMRKTPGTSRRELAY